MISNYDFFFTHFYRCCKIFQHKLFSIASIINRYNCSVIYFQEFIKNYQCTRIVEKIMIIIINNKINRIFIRIYNILPKMNEKREQDQISSIYIYNGSNIILLLYFNKF